MCIHAHLYTKMGRGGKCKCSRQMGGGGQRSPVCADELKTVGSHPVVFKVWSKTFSGGCYKAKFIFNCVEMCPGIAKAAMGKTAGAPARVKAVALNSISSILHCRTFMVQKKVKLDVVP